MEPLLLIGLVMLVAGSLGGLVNFFIADPEQEKRLPWWQHIVVGVTASFMVPLFLNMISGDLIDKIRGIDGKAGDYSKLFVLAGFCLVAAVSSRAFIRSLAERVMQEVRSAKEKAERAVTQAKIAAEQASAASADAIEARLVIAPLVEDETPFQATQSNIRSPQSPEVAIQGAVMARDTGTQASQKTDVIAELEAATVIEPGAHQAPAAQESLIAPVVSAADLSPSELAVLRVMNESGFALRTTNGIAQEAKLNASETTALLRQLMSKNLVGETLGKSGYPRWFLTTAGRRADRPN